MYHGYNRRAQPHNLEKLPIGRNAVVAHVRRPVTLGLIPEAEHLARLGVEDRVGREC